MIVEVDLGTIPPRLSLLEPDDFKSFKIVTRGDHAFVRLDELKSLAGDRAHDEAWLEHLAGMYAYAQGKGWTDSDGAIQAHIVRA